MKRLGLITEIQSSIRDSQENKKKFVIKKRHISPPPPNLEIIQSAQQESQLTEPETNISHLNPRQDNQQQLKIFQVPFQRRARSLSLPKDQQEQE